MSEETKVDASVIPNPEDVRPAFQQKYDYTNAQKLLELKHVKEYFRFKNGDVKYLKAVHDVSFDVYKGEVFGLVGESGCGKTTTGRTILRLYDLTSGSIYLEGVRIAAGTRWNEKEIKWTNVRAKKQIDDIHAQEEAFKEELAKNYEEAYGEQFKLSESKRLRHIKSKCMMSKWNKSVLPMTTTSTSIAILLKPKRRKCKKSMPLFFKSSPTMSR